MDLDAVEKEVATWAPEDQDRLAAFLTVLRLKRSPDSPEVRGTFVLNPEAEAALLASIEEADRGEVISGEELLRELIT